MTISLDETTLSVCFERGPGLLSMPYFAERSERLATADLASKSREVSLCPRSGKTQHRYRKRQPTNLPQLSTSSRSNWKGTQTRWRAAPVKRKINMTRATIFSRSKSSHSYLAIDKAMVLSIACYGLDPKTYTTPMFLNYRLSVLDFIFGSPVLSESFPLKFFRPSVLGSQTSPLL